MITIVSGLPRSGTSMMMQILHKSGMIVLDDKKRQPDVNNLHGYLEYQKVKQLIYDNSWLSIADNKAIKIVPKYLPFLPPENKYKILFIERNLAEVVHSQELMLQNLGGKVPDEYPDFQVAKYQEHLAEIKRWLMQQENIKVILFDYLKIINEPAKQIKRIIAFLDKNLDFEKMLGVVDPALYHQRLMGKIVL